ncbi:hypothetical protein RFM99_25820 [Mesorhizobium sp. VK4C]|uniref:hypothetical protein n=1 Tax=Mesorhizobium captivum TaxID=3072319 RepID=UPI002A2464E9|nr:hypothetical protein [Mesorhizobium sp. VK4C]MDX8501819.1 hypothetical protein [Mesorhizobium sp. VK4C]
MYHALSTNLLLGYHGCDEAVGEKILAGNKFEPSENDYDWLGHGIYFWEANPERALSFAHQQVKWGRVKKPMVVGAALTLGNCIDTLNEQSLQALSQAYDKLVSLSASSGNPVPFNEGGTDALLRRRDCAVVMTLHKMIEDINYPPADSLRGLYQEGGALYDGSGFFKKSHIQICIRNPDCIKGVFRLP